MNDFVHDLPRLLALYHAEQEVARRRTPVLRHLTPLPPAPRAIGVLAGSFNPLTRGHTALAEAARRVGLDGMLLLLPLRAVDKELVTRASAIDRALVLTEWARRHVGMGVGVALTNRGLYVEQAALLAARYPASRIVFVVGHDKIVQIFDPRYYTERDAALRALFTRASFRVAPRAGQDDAALRGLLSRDKNRPFAGGVAPLAIDTDVDALSSTVVRERARNGEAWEALVPDEAARFISAAHPYSPPTRLSDGEEIDRYGLRLALISAATAGRLDEDVDLAELYRAACAGTTEGRRLRNALSEGKQDAGLS